MNCSHRMKRCECTGIAFSAVARFSDRTGIGDFEQLCRATGCGSLCTACHLDLKAHLDDSSEHRTKQTAAIGAADRRREAA